MYITKLVHDKPGVHQMNNTIVKIIDNVLGVLLLVIIFFIVSVPIFYLDRHYNKPDSEISKMNLYCKDNDLGKPHYDPVEDTVYCVKINNGNKTVYWVSPEGINDG